MEFKYVFKEVLIDIQALSKRTGIDDSSLYDYLYGAMPNIENAITIANELNCSLNYLMGLDYEPNKINFKKTYNIALFTNKYNELLKENNVTHYYLSKKIGLTILAITLGNMVQFPILIH